MPSSTLEAVQTSADFADFSRGEKKKAISYDSALVWRARAVYRANYDGNRTRASGLWHNQKSAVRSPPIITCPEFILGRHILTAFFFLAAPNHLENAAFWKAQHRHNQKKRGLNPSTCPSCLYQHRPLRVPQLARAPHKAGPVAGRFGELIGGFFLFFPRTGTLSFLFLFFYVFFSRGYALLRGTALDEREDYHIIHTSCAAAYIGSVRISSTARARAAVGCSGATSGCGRGASDDPPGCSNRALCGAGTGASTA